MLAFVTWWLVMQVLGLAALPLARRIFARLPDEGFAFSKTAGLLLVAYLLWVGASSGLLVNDTGGALLALLAAAGLSAWAGLRGSREPLARRIAGYWRSHKGNILQVEALFLLTFAFWTLVRAYTPDKILPSGGEKYMEIAFLNGILNSPHFPPLDPWMAGYGIAYYYFGYVMMAVMVRLTGAAATVGFDLYDALLFALTAVSAYGVVSNMVRASRGTQRAAGIAGTLGALFAVGMGNLEGLLEGLYSSRALPAGFWELLRIPDLAGSAQSGSFYPGHGWWWWRASRVIQDLDLFYQPIVYQPIDEFPFFSFLLGDNHPHKLALPFSLLAVGLALQALLRAREPDAQGAITAGLAGWRRQMARLRVRRDEVTVFLFSALALGGLAFLNTWDFPILLGIVVLARTLGAWNRLSSGDAGEPPKLARIAVSALGYAAALGAVSIGLYLFFFLGFTSQAGGILPHAFPPTRLPQYLVMFGPFVFILAVFSAAANRRANGFRGAVRRGLAAWAWLAGGLIGIFGLALLAGGLALPGSENLQYVERWLGGLSLEQALLRIVEVKVANPWLFLTLTAIMAMGAAAIVSRPAGDKNSSENRAAQAGLPPAGQFALLLAVAGLGLTLAVEFFYLQDNFGLRMNTVFKFYFQGWMLMACASAYAAWWTARQFSSVVRTGFLLGAGLLTAAGLVYPVMSIASRTEGFSRTPNLDAAATFAGFYPGHWAASPDDYAAAQWLTMNAREPGGEIPLILEAGSGGYEIAGRMSAFTGFPTLLGWTNHEGQWRGTQEQIEERKPVIREIFTTPSAENALETLQAWQVDYVIVGDVERQYVASICQNPDTPCQVQRALEKFDRILEPVFSQGGTTIYRVPAAIDTTM